MGQNDSQRTDPSTRSVLFFGRAGCAASAEIHTHLQDSGFDVIFIQSNGRGERLPEVSRQWRGAYILCFRSLFVLPASILETASIAAVNFHPAPPEYPGSGCINFALYDESDTYGVTAHIMNEKVDNGRILDVRRFAVHPNDDLSTVLERTHAALLDQCLDFVTGISKRGQKFIDEKLDDAREQAWSGEARKMRELDALQVIDPTVSEAELKRIIRATYTEAFPPKIRLHGHDFVLRLNKDTGDAT